MNQKDFDIVYKEKLLDTFKFLIDFLNKNDLRWWTAYGTIIGAVRHHGLIPWDDDIDIWMPREDYQKLLSLQNEFENGKYGLRHVCNDKGFGARFAKAMDMTTTIQAQSFIPSVMGVFVDVFPLDSSNEAPEVIKDRIKLINEKWIQYFSYIKHYSFSDLINCIKTPKILKERISTNLKCNAKQKQQLRQEAIFADQHASPEIFGKSKYCFSLYGFSGDKDIFMASWFDGFVEVPFEGISVRIPKGYHELLTHFYGDYMTPPPIEQRIPRHKPYYINLKERLTVEEVTKRVKLGETKVL